MGMRYIGPRVDSNELQTRPTLINLGNSFVVIQFIRIHGVTTDIP